MIQTIKSFIEKGSRIGLTSQDWVQTYLLLAKKYLTLIFPSLSRHANNLDALFKELDANVNQEQEVAKLQNALSSISRKVPEQVQICLFIVKTIYTMILSINQPHFNDEKLQVRADFLAISVIPHMVNTNTNAASQEQMGTEYQITATLFLPEHCTMLDLQSLEANSVKDLVISQTQLVNQTQTKPFVRNSR